MSGDLGNEMKKAWRPPQFRLDPLSCACEWMMMIMRLMRMDMMMITKITEIREERPQYSYVYAFDAYEYDDDHEHH